MTDNHDLPARQDGAPSGRLGLRRATIGGCRLGMVAAAA
jgi:hypothetical protein